MKQSSLLKFFLSYFPTPAWVIIIAALLLSFIVPKMEPWFNLIITFTFFYLFLKLKTIIHECGHLVAGYWVGATPKRMILGSGHEVYRTEWNGVKIVLNSVPMGGTAIAIFNDLSFIRLRFLVYILGGVLFNILAAFIFLILFGYDPSFLFAPHGIDLPSAFIAVNVLGITNLIPYYSSQSGSKTPTDGLWLLLLLFGSKEKFQNLKFGEDHYQAFEYFENREYDKAYNLYQNFQEKIPQQPTSLFMMAAIRIKQGQPEQALSLLTVLEGNINSKEVKKSKGLIYNNIAWTHLLRGDFDRACDYALKALKEMPKSKLVGGTYGSALIEAGQIDNGMQWLAPIVDFKHPNDTTLTASIYMMLGFHSKKDFVERDRHMAYVRKNEIMLEKDTVWIWKRTMEKINYSVSSLS